MQNLKSLTVTVTTFPELYSGWVFG